MLLHEVHDPVGVLHIHLRSSNRRPYPFSSRFRIILVLACCLLYAQAVLSGLLYILVRLFLALNKFGTVRSSSVKTISPYAGRIVSRTAKSPTTTTAMCSGRYHR